MKQSLGLKLGAIGLLVILLLVGLFWIGAVVGERQVRRDGVVREIAHSSSTAQTLQGPMLVVPYERTVQEWHEDAATGSRRAVERQVRGQLLFLPEVFRAEGEVPTERRARGIYEARLYHANLRIRAGFDVPEHYGVGTDVGSYRFEQPVIALGITDIRGIEKTGQVLVNDAPSACPEFQGRVLGVSFVQPVDPYLKTDRAIKYALLFIALTFGGFFLFEVLKKLAVHPIQYGLVGAALALFYLLLLSLSEHVGFGPAYILSATACSALIGFYVGSVLRSAARGLGFAGGLALLYATLYALVSADDYALLMGSALLFGLLTAVMVLTRNVDWFSLGRQPPEERP